MHTCTGYADFAKSLVGANPNPPELHECRQHIPFGAFIQIHIEEIFPLWYNIDKAGEMRIDPEHRQPDGHPGLLQ